MKAPQASTQSRFFIINPNFLYSTRETHRDGSRVEGRMTVPESHFPLRPRSLVVAFERGGRIRRFHLDHRVSLAIGAIFLVIGIWALAMTAYLVFRDDVAAALVSRETEMREAYEDRIAALRSTIDRIASRQLVDQDTVENRVEELAARQATLETRQAMVAAIAGMPGVSPGKAGGVTVQARSGARGAAQGLTTSAATLPDGASAFAPIDLEQIPAITGKPRVVKETGPFQPILRGTQVSPAQDRTSALETPAGKQPHDRLAGLAQRLAAIETSQQAALAVIERGAKAKAERVESVLAEAGLAASRFRSLPKAALPPGQGGPLVPVSIDPAAGPFEAQLARTQHALVQADRLGRILDVVPLRRPLSGEPELSSGFGTRLDPFTRGIAMHTGLDFRGDTGDPVRVTAPGRVVSAEWSGGYGNMVEVDHGNGLTTRYGHLSAILVSPGDWVDRGATVGRLGSTGRSTGPHLHYETRIDGEAVDPLRFLRAGEGLNG